MRTRRASTWKLWAAALLTAALAPLACAELALRLLPVYEGTSRLPVNDRHPIARLEPDREFTWSRGWDFPVVNTVRVNNAGFVSDADYEPDAPGPLLAVIGDSFVEAAMLPYRRTCAGRLATVLEPGARVYAFGLSGAALGQYLAWARYARDAFGPDGLVVIVVENDYDQSLIEYGDWPGMHYFADRGDGRLVLERVDFAPSLAYRLARRSALARYLAHHLKVRRSIPEVYSRITGRPARSRRFSLRSPASAAPGRVSASKRAVDAFLDLLLEYSGLDPDRIVFVVDGIRPDLYDHERLDGARGSFVDVMNRYFLASADRKGYEVIDLQPRFTAHYREHGQRFEWPRDPHWNTLGHERCFEAVAGSELLAAPSPVRPPAVTRASATPRRLHPAAPHGASDDSTPYSTPGSPGTTDQWEERTGADA